MMRWVALISLVMSTLVANQVRAEERYAIVIGNNQGEKGELPLRYAEADAEKIATVLLDLGGVAAENMTILQGATSEQVEQALITINQRIRSGEPENTSLIVYYSGHADAEALHLGDTTVGVERLRGLVEGSPAAFRLLIVDACRSGGFTQVKGGTVVSPTMLKFQDKVVGEGMVYLSATAANEDAQESEEIRGSFFTHYLATGMLGAADDNGDGAVDLNEAYRFAYDNTLRASSRSLAGMQHPTFRQELKGKGDVVLTHWATMSARTILEFPPRQNWLVIRDSEGGPIVAELGADDEQRRISVRPGRYFLLGRGPNELLEATVNLGPDEVVEVGSVPVKKTEYARLVRKGGASAPRVSHSLEAGYRLRSGLEADSGICNGAYGLYLAAFRPISVGGKLGFCRGGFTIDGVVGESREIDLSLELHRPIDLKAVTLDFAVSGAVAFLRQRLPGVPIPDSSFVSGADERETVGAHGEISIGLQYDFGPGFYASAAGAAMLYLFRREGADASSALKPVFAARLEIGLGKRFNIRLRREKRGFR